MENLIFVFLLGTAWASLLTWGVWNLPDERWQFLASVPVQRQGASRWQGINLTYYGFFVASAVAASAGIAFVLMGSAGVSPAEIGAVVGGMLLICVPMSKGIARVVEKKHYTFTVGGASFAGMLVAPGVIALRNAMFEGQLDTSLTLAAIAVPYALGEGIGRLACISFGCCYGKPVAQAPPVLRGLFSRLHFTFSGGTKKIAYEGGSEGIPTIPIQALSSVVNLVASLAGTALFLAAEFRAAFLVTVLVSQGWRFLSEFLRADDRGGGRVSAYQIMALFTVAWALLLSLLLPPSPALSVHLRAGLNGLWSPALILSLEALWMAIFLYTGRSRVTGADLAFFVHRDRV